MIPEISRKKIRRFLNVRRLWISSTCSTVQGCSKNQSGSVFWSHNSTRLAHLGIRFYLVLPYFPDFFYDFPTGQVNAQTGLYEKDPSCQSCPVPGSPNEDNWVWSPQCGSQLCFWCVPSSHPMFRKRRSRWDDFARYEIAMHLPERWGILQFEDSKVNETGASYYQDQRLDSGLTRSNSISFFTT